MQGLNIIEILKLVGLPGIVIIGWIYDILGSHDTLKTSSWLIILTITILASFITQTHPKDKEYIELIEELKNRHKELIDTLTKQCELILSLKESIKGNLDSANFLQLIPLMQNSLKWIVEESLLKVLCSVSNISLISKEILIFNVEMNINQKFKTIYNLSATFKIKSFNILLNKTMDNIIKEVSDSIRNKSLLVDKDIFSLRTIIDNNFNECAEEMAKILKDDIDESTFDKFYSSIPKPQMDTATDTFFKIN